jgi:hypothetical protein
VPRSRKSSTRRRSSRAASRIGSIASYGPDNTRATKLVASVIDGASDELIDLRVWHSDGSDIRHDPIVAAEIRSWLSSRGVSKTTAADRIIGCPHEEGIDYPMGRVCPRCPFWATIDRFTHEPIEPPVASMPASQVLAELQKERTVPPFEALESADAHSEALTQPLLDVLARAIGDPKGAADDEARLASYALYLFAKWREPWAYPLVVEWLSLPGDGAFDLAGDVVTQDGGTILASVFDGDLSPIRRVILNPDADVFVRSAGIVALSQLALWAEVPRDVVVEEFRFLAEAGLEREPSWLWGELASQCADLELMELFPRIRQAYRDGFIDPIDIEETELDEIEASPGATLERTRDRHTPIFDVAEATGWWAEFSEHARPRDVGGSADSIDNPWSGESFHGIEPFRAPPKVGRNEPCPCGSGKKYKKCCGA